MNNPYSQFQEEYALEDILKAPMVYAPLTKLQCCPTSDGAGAAILASEDFVRKHGLAGKAVEIAGMAMTTDFPSSFEEKSSIKLVGSDMTRKAAQRAYEQSGVGPEQLDVPLTFEGTRAAGATLGSAVVMPYGALKPAGSVNCAQAASCPRSGRPKYHVMKPIASRASARPSPS